MSRDPEFRLYNTLARSVEPVVPAEPEHLRFYSCGPTVYSFAHIGNFRSFLTADLILRTAQAIGWKTTYVTNVTDVGHLTEDDAADAGGEDRMTKALQSKDGSRFANVWDLARFYTDELLRDWQTLNLREPSVRPRATEHMREQISAVESLIEKGHAYETGQGIYFSVPSFEKYGRLSGNERAEELAQSVRDVVSDPEKRDARDFALWKKDPKHLMQWYSPWGWGFPGWHIECSVMAISYLGEEIDLHAGGEDLIFPHHECEIAQTESLTGKPFARHWVHTRFLQVEGEKMAKRTGNFFTVRDLVAPASEGGRGVDPLAVRLALISGQYRKPFNFTRDTLRASAKHVARFREVVEAVDQATGEGPDHVGERLRPIYERALAAMLDDLNTPEAIAAVIEGFKLLHGMRKQLNEASAEQARVWISDVNALLGVVGHEQDMPDGPESDIDPEAADIDALVAERQAARAARDFERADEIRTQLTEMGIEVMDTADGAIWKRVTTV